MFLTGACKPSASIDGSMSITELALTPAVAESGNDAILQNPYTPNDPTCLLTHPCSPAEGSGIEDVSVLVLRNPPDSKACGFVALPPEHELQRPRQANFRP